MNLLSRVSINYYERCFLLSLGTIKQKQDEGEDR